MDGFVYLYLPNFRNYFDTYVSKLDLSNIETIDIYYDFQNAILARNRLLEETEHRNIESIVISEVTRILKGIEFLVSYVKNKYEKNVRFFFFYDEGTNIVNEYLMSNWKENRRKAQLELYQNKTDMWFEENVIKAIGKMIIRILRTISKGSDFLYTYIFNGIDSDILPYISSKINSSEKTVNIIFSTDKDFWHMVMLKNTYYSRIFKVEENSNFYNAKNIYKLVNKHYKLEESERLVSKNIPFFQALTGDKIDGIGPIKQKYGIKKWLKITESLELKGYFYYEFRKDNRLVELASILDIDYDEFFKRLMLFDFFYISNYIKNKVNKTTDFYTQEVHKVFGNNPTIIEILKNFLKEVSYVNRKEDIELDDLEYLSNMFNIDKSSILYKTKFLVK